MSASKNAIGWTSENRFGRGISAALSLPNIFRLIEVLNFGDTSRRTVLDPLTDKLAELVFAHLVLRLRVSIELLACVQPAVFLRHRKSVANLVESGGLKNAR